MLKLSNSVFQQKDDENHFLSKKKYEFEIIESNHKKKKKTQISCLIFRG